MINITRTFFRNKEFFIYDEDLCVQCMHIRRIRPGDSRMDIGRIYEGKSKTLREEQYPYLLSDYAIRLLRSDEVYLLKDFLYEAIFIPKDMKAPPKTIVNQSEFFDTEAIK